MKLIRRFKKRFRRWNAWRKTYKLGALYKLRVLFGLVHSPSFEYFILPDEYPNVRNMYHGVDMINNEAFEATKALGASFDNAYNSVAELNGKGEK